MRIKELIEQLSYYDKDAQIRLAWYSNGNYNWPTDNFNLEVYQDTYEDDYWNILASKDVVIDLWDFNF